MESKTAIWGLVLTAIGTFVAVYTCHHNNVIDDAKLKQQDEEIRLKSVEAEQKYQERVQQIKINKALTFKNDSSIQTKTFLSNHLGSDLLICIGHEAPSQQWLVEGYFPLKYRRSLSLDEFKEGDVLYLGFIAEHDTSLRYLKVGNNWISSFSERQFPVRAEKESFAIIDGLKPPYKTITMPFYKIKIGKYGISLKRGIPPLAFLRRQDSFQNKIKKVIAILNGDTVEE
jgi:hypothetical protein